MLVEVLTDEGNRVKKGQLLASLDISRFEAKRRELVADLALKHATKMETEARLTLAGITVKRRKSLLKGKNVSAQRYDEARDDEHALRATLQADNAAIERVASRLLSGGDQAGSRVLIGPGIRDLPRRCGS